jgi:hypothetical protein
MTPCAKVLQDNVPITRTARSAVNIGHPPLTLPSSWISQEGCYNDQELSEVAGELKVVMSLTDCFAAALAKREKAEKRPLRNDVPSKPDQRSEAIERLNPLELVSLSCHRADCSSSTQPHPNGH